MRKVTMLCDHCGKELNYMDDYPDVEISMWNDEVQADLCESCLEQLKQTVRTFCGKEVKDNE